MARYFFWLKCGHSGAGGTQPQRGATAAAREIREDGEETKGGSIRHGGGGEETKGGSIRHGGGGEETKGGSIRHGDGGEETKGGSIRHGGGQEIQGGSIRHGGGQEIQGASIRHGGGQEVQGGHIRPGTEGHEIMGGHIRQRAVARNASFNLLGTGFEFYAGGAADSTARAFATEAEAKQFSQDPAFASWAAGATTVLTSIDID